jgi:hypothetical protein
MAHNKQKRRRMRRRRRRKVEAIEGDALVVIRLVH